MHPHAGDRCEDLLSASAVNLRFADIRGAGGSPGSTQDGPILGLAVVPCRPFGAPPSSARSSSRVASMQRQRLWLILHLGLGLAWIALLASRAPGPSGLGATGPQVAQMLLGAGWLPSLALACWQVNHRQWRALLLSDLLAAGLLTLVAVTLYVPLFFFNVAWFLPLALLPRGLLSEGLVRLLNARGG
jgi:hypothetical protein